MSSVAATGTAGIMWQQMALAVAAIVLTSGTSLATPQAQDGGAREGTPVSDPGPPAQCPGPEASAAPQPMVSRDVQHDVSPPLRSITPVPLSPPIWIYQVPSAASSPCPSTPVTAGPTIAALAPAAGQVGTEVRISGAGFTPRDNAVHFGAGYIPGLPSPDSTTIVFAVPDSLDPACLFAQPRCLLPSVATQPGTYQVAVSNSNGMSNAVTFTTVPRTIP
jgi:hypothetical protein